MACLVMESCAPLESETTRSKEYTPGEGRQMLIGSSKFVNTNDLPSEVDTIAEASSEFPQITDDEGSSLSPCAVVRTRFGSTLKFAIGP